MKRKLFAVCLLLAGCSGPSERSVEAHAAYIEDRARERLTLSSTDCAEIEAQVREYNDRNVEQQVTLLTNAADYTDSQRARLLSAYQAADVMDERALENCPDNEFIPILLVARSLAIHALETGESFELD